MIKRRLPKREFKLRSRLDEEPEGLREDFEREKHVQISRPDRSHYPRILDFWPVFALVGLLTLVTILILRWLS
ncbi:MAG TPA: hypothetical protein ENN07_04050 [candidate division Zixibacteria bacterium]|nr:hypothetical protein [candidate division Zixibacteria bacterium]